MLSLVMIYVSRLWRIFIQAFSFIYRENDEEVGIGDVDDRVRANFLMNRITD